jgi:hypothetical protein
MTTDSAMPDDTPNMDPRPGVGLGGARPTSPGSRVSSTRILRGDRCQQWEPFTADVVLFKPGQDVQEEPRHVGHQGVPTDKTYPFRVAIGEGENHLTVRIHTTEPAPTLRTSSAASRWCPGTTRSSRESTGSHAAGPLRAMAPAESRAIEPPGATLREGRAISVSPRPRRACRAYMT